MQATLTQYLTNISAEKERTALLNALKPLFDRMSSQAHTSAALEIAAGGSAAAQIGSAVTFKGVAAGVPVTIAAGTDMPALTGINITAGSFRIVGFFIDSASTVTAVAGKEGTTLALAKFPEFPFGKALVGYLIITYASAFTGGTTPLDTATTVYVSPVGAVDPSILP